MEEIEIKKIPGRVITKYKYKDEEGKRIDIENLFCEKQKIQKYRYEVERKSFNTKEKAQEYKKWLEKIWKELNYKKIELEAPLWNFLCNNIHCDEAYSSYSMEPFWCYIKNEEDWNILSYYLHQKYYFYKRKFPEFKEKGWYCVSYIDWDDGDYDNSEESWELLVLSKKIILSKINEITEQIPGE